MSKTPEALTSHPFIDIMLSIDHQQQISSEDETWIDSGKQWMTHYLGRKTSVKTSPCWPKTVLFHPFTILHHLCLF
jgi:hypothetical protein